MIHFAAKGYFFLLLTVPLLLVWHQFVQRRGQRFVWYSSQTLIREGAGPLKVFSIRALFYLKILALIVFIVALARPQILNYLDRENKRGIDIMLTLDISGSMASIDFQPRNRLEVAKEVIDRFIQKRLDDRIGLVAFAGNSLTGCPLTVDYDILRNELKRTAIGDLEDGTALGMALSTAVGRMYNPKNPYKNRANVIILLTDGVNNRGEIDPRDAAKMAKTFNIKVYTIGVGTRGQAPYPVTDAYGNTQYVMLDVEIDEELLKEIANGTGGLYFRATDKNTLQQIFAEIDRMEKTEITTHRHQQAHDIYHYFLMAALALLFISEFLKRTIFRTLP